MTQTRLGENIKAWRVKIFQSELDTDCCSFVPCWIHKLVAPGGFSVSTRGDTSKKEPLIIPPNPSQNDDDGSCAVLLPLLFLLEAVVVIVIVRCVLFTESCADTGSHHAHHARRKSLTTALALSIPSYPPSPLAGPNFHTPFSSLQNLSPSYMAQNLYLKKLSN